MRRQLLIYILLAAVSGAVFWACQRDRFGHDDPNAVEPTLTVNEARDFFEYQFSETMPYLTKLPQDRPTGMMPGDFTPLWNKARIGANREMDGADVPIDPKFIFVAVFNRVTPQGDTVRRTVDVIQKLVVKKWRDTEEYEAFCYIASIVPTPEYYARHKNVGKEFRYAGSKGDFSGFVVYRTLEGIPVAIDNYRDGIPVRHDYFPRITKENADSVSQVVRLATGPVAYQAGTPNDYEENNEILRPDEDVTITAPKPRPDFPDRPEGLPTDPPKDPIDWPDYGGGNYPGGGGGGSNPNTGNTPSVSTLFNAQGFTPSEIAEINSILSKLSSVGISNKVLTKLMEKGKITLKSGTVSEYTQSYAVYALQTNTLTINMVQINASEDKAGNFRNSIMEETFHAFQYQTYGTRFNERCFEFEAKVYGTIVLNQYAPNPNGTIFLNPMVGLGEAFGTNFANDIKRYTGNFTHGISSGDMNTLYQDYGRYCTQYPAGDPNWEFKAIQNAQQ